MELKKSIHIYNFDSKTLANIRVGLLKNKLPMCKVIPKKVEKVKVSEVLQGAIKEAEELLSDEKLVLLGGLSNSEINRVINVVKRSGNGKAPLFSVITETNYNWTLKELIEELCKERDYFNENGKPMEEDHDK